MQVYTKFQQDITYGPPVTLQQLQEHVDLLIRIFHSNFKEFNEDIYN